jgi:hypothetical protein
MEVEASKSLPLSGRDVGRRRGSETSGCESAPRVAAIVISSILKISLQNVALLERKL